MSDEVKTENGLSFKLDLRSHKLLAVVQPSASEDRVELDAEIVKQRLVAAELANFFVNDHLIFDLVHRYNHANDESFELEIGEQRNATFDVIVSENKMKVRLTLTQNFGGKAIQLEEVQKILQEKKITWGVMSPEDIEAILAKGNSADFIVAQGLEPVAGVDAKFESLIPVEKHDRKPLVNEDGSVDYRELGDILIVHKDDLLMQRTPPVKGKAGYNVLGEIVNPTGGADTPFSGDKKGVCVSSEDSNQLLSAITGQPILVPNGIIVTPVLTVRNVDFKSGNIRFDGSVIVQGDVEEGMHIYALEDITIDGSVTDAKIECMGNLVIKGGVTGDSELLANGNIEIKGGAQGYQETEESDDPDAKVAKIVAHGSVIVGFAENFRIEAGVDIVVEKYSMNNQLMAENKIVAGAKNSGKKSSIMGGVTWAMMLVKGTIMGSTSGIKTHVEVGSNPYLHRRLAELRDKLVPNEKEQKDIKKILEFISIHPEKSNPEMLEKLHHTLSKLVIEADLCHAEQKELAANMSIIDDAKIIAERGVYAGTEIKINSVLLKVQENRGKSVFRVERREMTINSR